MLEVVLLGMGAMKLATVALRVFNAAYLSLIEAQEAELARLLAKKEGHHEVPVQAARR